MSVFTWLKNGSDYLNVENRKTYVEKTAIKYGWLSAQWILESTGDTGGSTFRIRNRWTDQCLYEDVGSGGAIRAGFDYPAQADEWELIGLSEETGGTNQTNEEYFNIRNLGSRNYLHTRSDTPAADTRAEISEPSEEYLWKLREPFNTEWVTDYPDKDQSIAGISIPGSHDSAASFADNVLGIPVEGPNIWDVITGNTVLKVAALAAGISAITQESGLLEQLIAGIRYFDIRLKLVNGELRLYHGIVDLGATFRQALEAFSSFLNDHPGEFVIMLAKPATDDQEGISAKFDEEIAPYRAILRMEDSIPTIREAQGKITLLRGFDLGGSTSGPYGIDVTAWKKNDKFSIVTPGGTGLQIQDLYDDPDVDVKKDAIAEYVDKASAQFGSNPDLFLNYTSATGTLGGIVDHHPPKYFASLINPWLPSEIKDKKGIGVIVMDFTSIELARAVYELN